MNPLITPLINLLLRTSNRKVEFNRMLDCIKSQTYTNWKLHISVDTDDTEAYVRESGVDCVIHKHKRMDRMFPTHNPYNNYMNTLLDSCSEGWLWCIDDDDILPNNDVLANIAKHLIDDNYIHIYKMYMQFCGRIVPPSKHISKGNIGAANPVVPVKYSQLSRWQPCRAGDYQWIERLVSVVGANKLVWHDDIIYTIPFANNGSMDTNQPTGHQSVRRVIGNFMTQPTEHDIIKSRHSH